MEPFFDFVLVPGYPAYKQIEEAITLKIKRGLLPAGSRLPGSREFSRYLHINRKTAVKAIDNLITKGWLYTNGNKGTFVKAELPRTYQHPKQPASMKPAAQLDTPHLENSLSYSGRRDQRWKIVFDDGLPDPAIVPVHKLTASYRWTFRQHVRFNSLEAVHAGESALLHDQVSRLFYRNERLLLNRDHICCIQGNMIALLLVAKALSLKGKTMVVGNPGNPEAWQVFRNEGAALIPVDITGEGMDLNRLEMICRRKHICAVYVMPRCQYPTTITWNAEYCLRLLEMAERYDFMIIEADYDRECWFGDKPFYPLISHSPEGRVIYLTVLSKIFPPLNTFSVVAGPGTFIYSLKKMWALLDRHGDNVFTDTLANLAKEGIIASFSRKAARIYRQRRDVFAAMLADHLPGIASCKKPLAGQACWISFNRRMDMPRILTGLTKEGVHLPPPRKYNFDGKSLNGMRMGYGLLSPERLEAGLKALLAVIAKYRCLFLLIIANSCLKMDYSGLINGNSLTQSFF